MMLIPCPWCGPRNEDEFTWGGEDARVRPIRPDLLEDSQWADYLYNNDNVKGLAKERWWHLKGCGRWFVIERDNVSHRIGASGNGVSQC